MKRKQKSIHVLFTAAEADPYVKIGGLGDVAGSLPVAIHQLTESIDTLSRVDIRLVLPLHKPIKESFDHLKYLGEYLLESGARQENVQVYQDQSSLIPVYFLDGEPIRKTSGVYSLDSSQDAEKYIFFSLALLKLPQFLKWEMDILHANDWHTAIGIYALKMVPPFQDPHIRTVLSVHNLPYLGEGCQTVLGEYRIPAYPYGLLPSWAFHLPLPLGFITADLIIPVSPGYAQEIQTPDFGCGLEHLLQSRSNHIIGIVNGINQDQWNPATDPFIPSPYDLDRLSYKKTNKLELLQDLNLNIDPDIPLLIMITRMDHQKGVDIAVDGLQEVLDRPWQAILLGTGDPTLENRCIQLHQAYPDRIRSIIGFKSELSHQLYAAGDIFMMPSRYEPCGISQMISMRYGTIPVAHATGGLIDTISPTQPCIPGNGYLYTESSPSNFAQSLRLALTDYLQKDLWQTFQSNAMQRNFSWEKSASQYVDQYKRLVIGTSISTFKEG